MPLKIEEVGKKEEETASAAHLPPTKADPFLTTPKVLLLVPTLLLLLLLTQEAEAPVDLDLDLVLGDATSSCLR